MTLFTPIERCEIVDKLIERCGIVNILIERCDIDIVDTLIEI